MLTNMTMDLECEVQGCGALWQNHTFSFRSEHHDIIIIEGRCHSFHEVYTLIMTGKLLQQLVELIEPRLYVLISSLCSTSETAVADHSFG